MADETIRQPLPDPVEIRRISESAYARLMAIHDDNIRVAQIIADPNCYTDFFCEGHCNPVAPPFHEAFAAPGSSVTQLAPDKLARRMALVDRRRSGNIPVAAQRGQVIQESFTDMHPGGGGGGGFYDAYSDLFAESRGNGRWDEAWIERGDGPI